MEEPELLALVSQTSLLMEQFQRNCSRIDERLGQTWQALEGLSRQVPGVVQRSAEESLREVPLQVMNRIREGIDRPVSDYERRLEVAAKTIEEGSRKLGEQMSRTQALHRALLWKVTGVVGGAVVVLLVAAIWLSSHYMSVIRQNQIGAELLRAYNAADVVLCSDGRLCANVNPKGQKAGERGQYLPVNPR